MESHKVICWLSVFTLLLLSIAGCNDSGWNSSESSDIGIGWADVASNSVEYTDHGTGYADFTGTAFVSPSYVKHKCAGWACYETNFDDSDPGVTVKWENVTNSATGTAVSRYGTLTNWYHQWTASVPLDGGENEIVIRATDPAGNIGTARIVLEFLPPPPVRVGADTGNGQITLIWDEINGAQSYNIYWATTPGFQIYDASVIYSVVSSYVHNGLTNGEIYYYKVTSNSSVGESWPSEEAAGLVGAASRPLNLTATLSPEQAVLSWDAVPGAHSYNVYWSNYSDVTRDSGSRIADVLSPFTHSNLSGLPYYYVVTAENSYGESMESEKIRVDIPAKLPTPSGFSAKLNFLHGEITVSWNEVPGADYYMVNRCITTSNSCSPGSYRKVYGTRLVESLVSGAIYLNRTYGYNVSANNEYGASPRTNTSYVTPDCFLCIG